MPNNTQSYPQGVPERIRRPRQKTGPEGTLIGALAGLLLTKRPAGAVLGGTLGYAVTSEEPIPFAIALEQALAEKGLSSMNSEAGSKLSKHKLLTTEE